MSEEKSKTGRLVDNAVTVVGIATLFLGFGAAARAALTVARAAAVVARVGLGATAATVAYHGVKNALGKGAKRPETTAAPDSKKEPTP